MIQGFYLAGEVSLLEVFDINFDVDEYKIIRRFLRENNHRIMLLDA